MKYIFLFSEKTDFLPIYCSVTFISKFSYLPFILKNLFEEAITGSEKGGFLLL